MAQIEMVIDSIKVSLMNYQRVVILKEKEGERCLPIWIGPTEAGAIAIKLQGFPTPRPLTHDLLCNIANVAGLKIRSVVINKLRKDTFYCMLILTSHNKFHELDCRPSDAFAIAVRADAPIFVTKKILEEAGISTDEISKIDKSGKEPRAKILVVDDEERYLELVSNLLITGGYRVDTAVDGIDALAKIKGNRYSLLLTGIRMPYMSGFEFYKHIQKIDPLLANKTIIISGSVNDEDTREFLAENKLNYMAKPFDAEQLKKMVSRILTQGVN